MKPLGNSKINPYSNIDTEEIDLIEQSPKLKIRSALPGRRIKHGSNDINRPRAISTTS